MNEFFFDDKYRKKAQELKLKGMSLAPIVGYLVLMGADRKTARKIVTKLFYQKEMFGKKKEPLNQPPTGFTRDQWDRTQKLGKKMNLKRKLHKYIPEDDLEEISSSIGGIGAYNGPIINKKSTKKLKEETALQYWSKRIPNPRTSKHWGHTKQRIEYMTEPQLFTRMNRITDPEKMYIFASALEDENFHDIAKVAYKKLEDMDVVKENKIKEMKSFKQLIQLTEKQQDLSKFNSFTNWFGKHAQQIWQLFGKPPTYREYDPKKLINFMNSSLSDERVSISDDKKREIFGNIMKFGNNGIKTLQYLSNSFLKGSSLGLTEKEEN